MADNDFIIEEPETLDINPEREEEIIDVKPKEEVVSFDAPISLDSTVSVQNVDPASTQSVVPEVTPVVPVAPSIEPEVLDFDDYASSESSVSTPVYDEASPVEMATESAIESQQPEVTVAPVNVTPVTEESIIKEVATATPNKINDDVLKVEDTLLTNNLKEEIKKVEQGRDEEAQNRKAKIFIIAIFVLLGLTILLLPVLTNIFS